jgi:hypothetical protein
MYTLKVKKISVANESGDSVVIVTCYLVDSNGIAFKNSNGEVDTFTIRAPKSSVPLSGILAYLEGLAEDQILFKYTQELNAVGTDSSDILMLSESDIKKVFIDHTVSGVGISTNLNLDSIKSTTEAILSGDLTLEFTGNTTSPSFTRTGNVVISSNVISNVSPNTTGIVGGMSISGYGIPNGAVVIAINSSSQIVISQNALASTTGATLTFSTDSESAYATSLNPAIFTTVYEGLTIEGPSIPRDTTILTVESTSRVKLSQNATATTTSGTYVISGSPLYTFDPAGWTVDYADLSKVTDIIDFTEL